MSWELNKKSCPPSVSFFGIVIRMYYDDHRPPHFHAYYGEHEAVFSIETLEPLEGYLPRARALVLEWAAELRQALAGTDGRPALG
ncbi:MAG TPA: DUF4160 domain-containing protein [Methylothermaceae bacterium]|nr:DUF4160 domain-containing protein [Methylothermaceae bacterium]